MAESETDEAYVQRVALATLMDELVSHVVCKRSDNVLHVVRAWADKKMTAAAAEAGGATPGTGGLFSPSPFSPLSPAASNAASAAAAAAAGGNAPTAYAAFFSATEAALRAWLEDGLRLVRAGRSPEEAAQGVRLLDAAFGSLRCIVAYEQDVLFPQLDRACDGVATTHLLPAAAEGLALRAAEARMLLPSLEASAFSLAGAGGGAVHVAELQKLVGDLLAHGTHKAAVVGPAFASLPEEEQGYAVSLVLSLSHDKAHLLATTVAHLVETDAPYEVVQRFVEVVKGCASSAHQYKKLHAPVMRKAVEERSTVVLNLLVEDGLL